MWFTPGQIETPALRKLVQHNKNRIEKELANILLMVMEDHDLEEINICAMDVLNAISKTRLRTDLTQIRKILKKDWNLESQPNSHKYQKFTIWGDGSTTFIDGKGRYFTISKMFLTENFPEQTS
jgi:hypothetical protein